MLKPATPEVSIVMAAHNAAETLEMAVGAALAQEGVNFEVVVVNDGSADETPEMLDTWSDRRLVVLHQDQLGQSAALNEGVRRASGSWIKFMDADDWINPGHVQAQLDAVKNHPGAVASCRWGYFDVDPLTIRLKAEASNRDYQQGIDWLRDCLLHDGGMMGGWTWLIPKELLEKTGGWNPALSLNNDFDFSIRTLLVCNGVRHAERAIYGYRKSQPATLSSRRSRAAMESAWQTTDLGCRALMETAPDLEMRSICANRYRKWEFEFYPQYPDLAKKASRRVEKLGGSALRLEGGAILSALLPLIGWRGVRRLQVWSRKYGWNLVLKAKQGRLHAKTVGKHSQQRLKS